MQLNGVGRKLDYESDYLLVYLRRLAPIAALKRLIMRKLDMLNCNWRWKTGMIGFQGKRVKMEMSGVKIASRWEQTLLKPVFAHCFSFLSNEFIVLEI